MTVSGLNAAQANQKWFPCTIGSSLVPARGPVSASPRMLHAEPVCSSTMTPSLTVNVRESPSVTGSNTPVEPTGRLGAAAVPANGDSVSAPYRTPRHRAHRPRRLHRRVVEAREGIGDRLPGDLDGQHPLKGRETGVDGASEQERLTPSRIVPGVRGNLVRA